MVKFDTTAGGMMGHVRIHFEAEHSETERVALDEAAAAFQDTLRTRGYEGVVQVEWSGELRRQSLNRDGTGGALLERPPADVGQSREADELVPLSSTVYDFEHKGGGYYDILVDGEVVDTVRGKDAAREAVLTLGG